MRTLRNALLLVAVAASSYAFGQQVTLDTWHFATDNEGTLTAASVDTASNRRIARAGVSWNAQFDDLRDYTGYAWYWTTIDIPQYEPTRRTILRFGAVDYLATVYVNGKQVGQHEGGYTPFSFDISEQVHAGKNQIAVRVLDPPHKHAIEGLRFEDIPHGKQGWYIPTGGLWQPVTLEFRPQTYIESVRVTSELSGRVQVDVTLKGPQPTTGSMFVDVKDRHGAPVSQNALPLAMQTQYQIIANVEHPEPWSPDDPALYSVEVRLPGNDPESIRYAPEPFSTRFGFRKLETRDGKFYLNGKPFYLIGALDQDFYPDTIYSPPSPEYVRREMQEGRKLGLNLLRCHIKVCEPEYLDAADEAGMLVWYEIPNWGDFSREAAGRGEKILEEMVARDWNHPSIVIQSIINESWGLDEKKEDQRAWLRGMYEHAKSLTAPLGRLIVDNSACCSNFHVRTDIADFHQYYSIPDHAADWDRWVADFASRPKWIFSSHGDAQPSGAEPLVVSEFGNWGLPELPEKLPWWFSRKFTESDITRPEGVQDRFHQYKLDRIFQSYDALAQATQRHQFLSLKHEIEEMRQHDSVEGYVITEFTDLNWESNGLLTMWRQPKVYALDLAAIQQPDVVLAHMFQRNFTAGQAASAELSISHFSDRPLKNSTLLWRTDTGQSGRVTLAQEPPQSSAVPMGNISFPIEPRVQSSVFPAHLYLELRDPAGSLLAENHYDFYIYPARPPQRTSLRVYDPGGRLPGLPQALASRGYVIAGNGQLLLATKWDEQVEAFLNNGGHVVLLAGSADALPTGAPVQLKERKGDYNGDWVSNFAWILPDSPVFRDIAAGPILGWEAAAVTPRFVLQGVRPEDYGDVLSGMFYGWVNGNSPLLLQARAGNGALLLTTFSFDRFNVDAYAAALLDALLRYATSPEMRPRLQWRP